MTPLDKVEVLYQHLVAHYGEGRDREIRAASKLLMVALDRMKAHGGPGWRGLVLEYLDILVEDPARYAAMLAKNRSAFEDEALVVPVRRDNAPPATSGAYPSAPGSPNDGG